MSLSALSQKTPKDLIGPHSIRQCPQFKLTSGIHGLESSIEQDGTKKPTICDQTIPMNDPGFTGVGISLGLGGTHRGGTTGLLGNLGGRGAHDERNLLEYEVGSGGGRYVSSYICWFPRSHS